MEIKKLPSLPDLEAVVRSAASLMVTDHFEVTQKGGYSNIVTSSDMAVQDYLCKELSRILSGSGFFCEEKDLKCPSEYTWIIDPVDGTANYSRGIVHCAICVALAHAGAIQMGVVYLPWSNEMFSATKGGGSFCNGQPIHVSRRIFADGILCTALPIYHKEYAGVCAEIIYQAFMRCNDIRRFGACAPELCYVAMGRCDMYFEYMLSPWDYAAASLILEEAGGCIVGRDGQPVSLDQPSGVVAANNKENLNQLLDIVRESVSRQKGKE